MSQPFDGPHDGPRPDGFGFGPFEAHGRRAMHQARRDAGREMRAAARVGGFEFGFGPGGPGGFGFGPGFGQGGPRGGGPAVDVAATGAAGAVVVVTSAPRSWRYCPSGRCTATK